MLFGLEKNHLSKGVLLALLVVAAICIIGISSNIARAEGVAPSVKISKNTVEKEDFSKNLKYWVTTVTVDGFSAKHPILVEYTVVPNPTAKDWKKAGEIAPGEKQLSLDVLKEEKLDTYNLQVRACEKTGEAIEEEKTAKDEKAETEPSGSVMKEPTTESQMVKNDSLTENLGAKESGWITDDKENIQVGSVKGNFAPMQATVSRIYSYKTNAKNIRRGREYRYPKILINTNEKYLTEYRYRLDGGRWTGWVKLPPQSADHHFEKLRNLERKVYGRYKMDIETRWIDRENGKEVKGVATKSGKTITLGSRKIDFGQLAVKQVRKYKGARYYGGGESRYRIDCSGLVLKAWQPFGVNLYHKSDTQVHTYWRYCGRQRGLRTRGVRFRTVAKATNRAYKSLNKARPGDVLYWKARRRGGWSHVAIYTGYRNGKHYIIDSETAYGTYNCKPGVTEHPIGDYGRYSRGAHRVRGAEKKQLDKIVRYY